MAPDLCLHRKKRLSLKARQSFYLTHKSPPSVYPSWPKNTAFCHTKPPLWDLLELIFLTVLLCLEKELPKLHFTTLHYTGTVSLLLLQCDGDWWNNTLTAFLRSDGELAYSAGTVLDVFPNFIRKEVILRKIYFVQKLSIVLCKNIFEIAFFPKNWPLKKNQNKCKSRVLVWVFFLVLICRNPNFQPQVIVAILAKLICHNDLARCY